MGFFGQPHTEFPHEPRLADPRLAREQHHLALAVARLPPTALQQRDLLLAADKRREGRGLTRLGTALNPALARDPPDREKLGEALQALRPDVVEVKQPPTSRRVESLITTVFGAASTCIRAARCGTSPTTATSREAPSDQVAHHHRAGSNAYAGLELHVCKRHERSDGLGNR